MWFDSISQIKFYKFDYFFLVFDIHRGEKSTIPKLHQFRNFKEHIHLYRFVVGDGDGL